MNTIFTKNLTIAALVGASMGLAGCSGGTSILSGDTDDAKTTPVEGPLDVLQDQVVTGLVGTQIGGALPEPLGPTVQCAADAINSLVDAPDALLAALTNAAGGDPATALNGAADQFAGSLERFVADLQSTLIALTGGETCGTVAAGDSNGTPRSGNPLEGTPLATVGSALEDIASTLGGFSGSSEDPNLTTLTELLEPQLMVLSRAFDMLPAPVNEAPIVGGVLATLRDATGDLAAMLPAIGDYQGREVNDGLETLLNNLLSNVLLRVIPVEAIDEQTGQNVSGQIQTAINMAINTLGSVTNSVLITPAFDEFLDGSASPLLNPIENLLATIIGALPLPGTATASGTPLTGLLGGVAGDGRSSPLDGLLSLFTIGVDGTTLEDLTTAIGGNPNVPQLDQIIALVASGLPLDTLLGQLRDATAGVPVVSGVVGTVLNILGSVLGSGQG